MRVDNARRITGPSVLPVASPCVAVEWLHDLHERADPELAQAPWHELERVIKAIGGGLGVGEVTLVTRPYADGSGRTVALGAVTDRSLPGPIDRLLPLVDLLEWLSFELEAGRPFMRGDPGPRLAEVLAKWQEFSANFPQNPALVELEAFARQHRVPFLADDDHVSLGWGRSSATWGLADIPTNFELLDIRAFGRIPVALVTGTNGKTTTTRMLARILRHRGLHVGASSTDALTVDEQVIDAGDWSGPGAARAILRRHDIDAAVLETARGGILRRGLGVSREDGVDAAIVTNIGADHFGEYGVSTLAEMADVKGVVWDAVRPGGACVVNLDDPLLAERVARDLLSPSPRPWVGFSLEAKNPMLGRLRAAGQRVWFVDAAALVTAVGDEACETVLPVVAMPASLGGAATHNVANALGAAALAHALGTPLATIARGLASFGVSPEDNPGRLELHALPSGVRVVLDFGHNAHGIRALSPSIRALLAGHAGARLFVSLGAAGDRSEADFAALAVEIAALGPTRVDLRPLPGYERGRDLMEVPAMLEAAFLEAGVPATELTHVASETEFLTRALAEARPHDLLLVLVHVDREEVGAWLAAHRS